MSAETNDLPHENSKPMDLKMLSSGPLAVAKFLIESFSTVRQRDPPYESKDCHIRLITIGVSHFCEKTRFALDLLEAKKDNPYYYTEDAHPPGLQAYETLKASDNTVSRTPMVLFRNVEGDNMTILYDSDVVNKYFMPELYPPDIEVKIQEIESDLGKRVGATSRCFAYYHLLTNMPKYHEGIVALCADPKKVAKIESKVFDKFLEKGLGKGILKGLGITKESSEASAKALREIFAEMSKRLEENGGEYLLDTKTKSYGFTAADLTLAALASPLIRVPELKNWQIPEGDLPPELINMGNELKTTKAGQHVLKIYAKHRLPKGQQFVEMKYADRSKVHFSSWRTLGLASATATAVAVGVYLARK